MSSEIADKKADPALVTPHRRRGVSFWVAIVCVIILAVPILLYFGTLAYVSWGGLNRTIVEKVSRLFDTPATIGAVRTAWLRNLQVRNVTIEGLDKNPALTIGEVALDWDFAALLRAGLVRSATIERPQIHLRRDQQGRWNLRLKPPTGKETYRVEQFIMREGDLSLEWSVPRPGEPSHTGSQQQTEAARGTPPLTRSLRLQALSGTFADQGPLAPRSFSLYGVLDSMETASLNGSVGPGPTWDGRLFGGVKLERDLTGLLGEETPHGGARVRGHVRYDVSARSSAPTDGASMGPISFSGQFILEDFQWPLTPARALDTAERVIDLRGTATPGADPEALSVIDKLVLRVDSVGTLRGTGKLPLTPGPFVSLSKVHGTVDAEGLNQVLKPRLWNESVTLTSSLRVSDLAATLPLSADAPPFALSAQLAATGARIAVRGVGELPPCDATGTLAWPALRNVSVTVGDIGKAFISLNDVYPQADKFWLALGRGAAVHHVMVDIGRFWESEFGRRLLTGTLEQGKLPPAVSDLAYILKGQLSGTSVKLTLDEGAGKPTRVALENLRLYDAGLATWPLPFNVPARKLSGPVKLSALVASGTVQELTAQASLRSGGPDEANAVSVELEETCRPQEPPGKRFGPVRISKLVLPMEDVDQIFGLRALAGLSGTGTIELSDAVYDPASGSMDGTVELRNAKLTVALPGSVQAAMPRLLKLADYAVTGAVLEKYPIKTVTFSNVSARLDAEVKDGRMTLRGRIEPFDIRPDLPALGDTKLATLPATDVAIELDVAPASGGRKCTAALAWGSGTKFSVTLKRELPPAAAEKGAPGGAWRATGAVAAAVLGTAPATFDVPFDLVQQQAGPATFTLPEVDLSRLKKVLEGTAVQETNGHLKDLELRLKAFPLNTVSAATLANGEISGRLVGVHVASRPADVDRVDGDFRVVVNASGETVFANSTLRLSSYEALLGDGAFYIPPPAPGQGGWLRLVAKHTRREGGADVQVDSCQVNVGGEVTLDAAGALTFTKSDLSKANLEVLRLSIPDMAQTRKTFGPENLKNRDPWFGDIGLAGSGRFDGKLVWEAGGKLALDGKCLFDNTTLALGKSTVFKLEKMSGELPLILRAGDPTGVSGLPVGGTLSPAPSAPAELRGQIKLGPLAYSGITAKPQELIVVATPNGLAIATPIALASPLGPVTVADLSCRKLFNLEASPEIQFRMSATVPLEQVLRGQGVAIAGLEATVLSGEPLACTVRETSGLRGPWELTASGSLSGPFFGGRMIVERLNARGLFGPAPVFGGSLRLEGKEGIQVTQLMEKNPQWGTFHLRANAALTGVEATGFGLEGMQAGELKFMSVDWKDNDYWYDGRFAMTVAPELVRGALGWRYSDEYLASDKARELKFPVGQLGLAYRLANGELRGPVPLLPDSLIIKAPAKGMIGKLTAAVFGESYYQDVKGDPEHRIPWAQVLEKLKTAKQPAK